MKLLILPNVDHLPITLVADRTADSLTSGLDVAAIEQYPVVSYQQPQFPNHSIRDITYLCITMELVIIVESQVVIFMSACSAVTTCENDHSFSRA